MSRYTTIRAGAHDVLTLNGRVDKVQALEQAKRHLEHAYKKARAQLYAFEHDTVEVRVHDNYIAAERNVEIL